MRFLSFHRPEWNSEIPLPVSHQEDDNIIFAEKRSSDGLKARLRRSFQVSRRRKCPLRGPAVGHLDELIVTLMISSMYLK